VGLKTAMLGLASVFGLASLLSWCTFVGLDRTAQKRFEKELEQVRFELPEERVMLGLYRHDGVELEFASGGRCLLTTPRWEDDVLLHDEERGTWSLEDGRVQLMLGEERQDLRFGRLEGVAVLVARPRVWRQVSGAPRF